MYMIMLSQLHTIVTAPDVAFKNIKTVWES